MTAVVAAMFTDPEAARLGSLNQELCILLMAPAEDHEQALSLIVEQYGAEDVYWMLGVLKEDMGVS